MATINKQMKTFNVPNGNDTVCYEIVDANAREDISDLSSAISIIEPTTKELLVNPVVTHSTNSSVVDNQDGTFTFGANGYGTTEFSSPISLLPGDYELFGVPNGFTYISISQAGYSTPVASNDTGEPKKVTISALGFYYVGVRINSNQKPSTAFTITPSITSFEDRIAYKYDIYEDADILADKTIGQYSTNSAVTVNVDGTFTIGTTGYGTLMIGSKITLNPGMYMLFGVPNDNGFSFITENTTVDNTGSNCLIKNTNSAVAYYELSEQKQVYVGFRNKAKPTNAYTISPTLKISREKFVKASVTDQLSGELMETQEDVESLKDGFVVQFTVVVGYNLYANGEGGLVGPGVNSKRGYTQIDAIPAREIKITKYSTLPRYAIYERIDGHYWKETANKNGVAEYTHTFNDSADLYFIWLSTNNDDMPTGVTLISATYTDIAERKCYTAKDYIYEHYRQMATVLKQQNGSGESTKGCFFKAMLISDVHMQDKRMQNVVSLINAWGKNQYFDALINCGDTVNGQNDDTEWYDTAVSELTIPHINVLGNHDVNQRTAQNYYEKFIDPLTSQTGLVQPTGASSNYLCYYYYDLTNVRIIALDGNNMNSDQIAWLETVLADAKTNSKAVICCSHYGFSPTYATHIKCNWSYQEVTSASANITLAGKVKDFMDAGGTFICWLVGHEHADDLHVLEDYGNQLVITLPTLTTRALHLYPNPEDFAYNYNVMTYFVVDDSNKTIKMMRIGADIDMHGIRHQGVSLNYETGELCACW